MARSSLRRRTRHRHGRDRFRTVRLRGFRWCSSIPAARGSPLPCLLQRGLDLAGAVATAAPRREPPAGGESNVLASSGSAGDIVSPAGFSTSRPPPVGSPNSARPHRACGLPADSARWTSAHSAPHALACLQRLAPRSPSVRTSDVRRQRRAGISIGRHGHNRTHLGPARCR